MNKLILAHLFYLLTSFFTQAVAKTPSVPYSLPNTLVEKLQSKINGVHYRLYISLPKDYHSNTKRYPIIYTLDADYSFAVVKQISEHLSDRNRIKEAIIVGIAYEHSNEYKKNRTRDYTPSYMPSGGYGSEFQKYSGGAEKFYQFIHTELTPYINKQYRTNNMSTFIGHSFGGLFGVYLLLNHPSLFTNYVIVSPSLWYDNHILINAAERKTTLNFSAPTQVLFYIGEKENGGDYKMIMDLKRFNSTLNKQRQQHMTNFLKIIPNADHDTVFPSALTFALLKIYSNDIYFSA